MGAWRVCVLCIVLYCIVYCVLLLHCCIVVGLLFYCFIVLLFYCFIVLLFYCFIVLLFYCFIVLLFYCFIVLLFCFMGYSLYEIIKFMARALSFKKVVLNTPVQEDKKLILHCCGKLIFHTCCSFPRNFHWQ